MTNTSILVRSNWINIFIACVFFATASCSKDLSLNDEYFIGSWDFHSELLFQHLPTDPLHLVVESFCTMSFNANGTLSSQCANSSTTDEDYWYYRNNPKQIVMSRHEYLWDSFVIWDITLMEKNRMVWERRHTNAMGNNLNLRRRTFTRQ